MVQSINLRPTVKEGPAVRSRSIPLDHIHITATTIGTAQELFTVRDNVFLEITQLAIANLSGSSAKITLHTIPPGGTIGITNAEFIDLDIPANTILDVSENIQGLYKQGTVAKVYADTTAVFNIHGKAEEGL